MRRCYGLGNWYKFGLDNQQSGRYITATKLDLILFRPLPFGGLLWRLRTQVNYSDLASYITVFDPRRDKRRCFITFLVYDLVYPGIAGNLVPFDYPMSLV